MSHAVPADALPLQRLYHFEQHAPDQVAFTQPLGARHGGEVVDLTWREVMRQARCLAAHLHQLALEPGSRIAILSKNCAHWLIADYAIWLAGHVSVPLYPTVGAATVRQVLEHSGARLLFVGKLDDWPSQRPGVPETLPCIGLPLAPDDGRLRPWSDVLSRTRPLTGCPTRPAEDLATIIYTSGTTGQPKGVMHSFRTLTWAARAGIARVPLRPGGRLLSYLPLAHVAERALVEYGQLATGVRVFFAESLDTFVQDLQRARPTVFFSVPRLWVKFRDRIVEKMPEPRLRQLLRVPGVGALIRRKVLRTLGLEQCLCAVGGAAPMAPHVLDFFDALGLPITEVYGMTENGVLSHSTMPGRVRAGTVGWPFEGVESRIDPASREIQLRSGSIMPGYYRDLEQTAGAFTPDGWLRTGDCGEIERDGALRITGRVKDIFKTAKGKYVAPAVVEERLGTHPAVEACAVVGAGLPQPLGLVMLNEGAAAATAIEAARGAIESSLGSHLAAVNAHLEPHERLARLVVFRNAWTVDNGLVTPTLKVRRPQVEARFGPHFERWSGAGERILWSVE